MVDWSNAAPPTLPGISELISDYGFRTVAGTMGVHSGIDIAAPEGSPVFAVLPGRARVFPSGELHKYGNVVLIEHAPGFYSLSAHLKETQSVHNLDVIPGQLIGSVGRTAGTATDRGALMQGAHLHLEFLKAWPPAGIDRDRIDPVPILRALGVVAMLRRPLIVVVGSMAAGSAQALIAQRLAPPNSIITQAQTPPLVPARPDSNELLAELLGQKPPAPAPPTWSPTWSPTAAGDDFPAILILLLLWGMRKKGR